MKNPVNHKLLYFYLFLANCNFPTVEAITGLLEGDRWVYEVPEGHEGDVLDIVDPNHYVDGNDIVKRMAKGEVFAIWRANYITFVQKL